MILGTVVIPTKVDTMSSTVHGLYIPHDFVVQLVEVTTLQDMYKYTEGGPVDVVPLMYGHRHIGDMWVNDEYLYRDASAFNSVATDVAGLGGRTDLLLQGILGDVLITGPVDSNGDKTDVSDAAHRMVERVAREAGRWPL